MQHLDSEARARVLDILRHGRDMTLATLRADGYPRQQRSAMSTMG